MEIADYILEATGIPPEEIRFVDDVAILPGGTHLLATDPPVVTYLRGVYINAPAESTPDLLRLVKTDYEKSEQHGNLALENYNLREENARLRAENARLAQLVGIVAPTTGLGAN